MRDVLQILGTSDNSSLTICADGPPRYVGDGNQRIIIEGNAGAFRMLAQTLLAMAETVETDPAIRQHGWHLVLSPEDVPQLHMGKGYRLALNCEPDNRPDHSAACSDAMSEMGETP